MGDQTRSQAYQGKSNHYGVVVVRSNVWRGAVTCWREDRSVQIYVGDGLKNESKSYYPVYPPLIPEDPEDLSEYVKQAQADVEVEEEQNEVPQDDE